MRFLELVLSWAAMTSFVAADAVNDLENTGRKQIDAYIESTSKTCTKDKLMVRKEWYDKKSKFPSPSPLSLPGAPYLPPNDADRLFVVDFRGDISKEQRKAWIDAFQCLLKSPSKLDPKQFPGAHSRYDDFVVVHMNQTLSIHGTVSISSYPSICVVRLRNFV